MGGLGWIRISAVRIRRRSATARDGAHRRTSGGWWGDDWADWHKQQDAEDGTTDKTPAEATAVGKKKKQTDSK